MRFRRIVAVQSAWYVRKIPITQKTKQLLSRYLLIWGGKTGRRRALIVSAYSSKDSFDISASHHNLCDSKEYIGIYVVIYLILVYFWSQHACDVAQKFHLVDCHATPKQKIKRARKKPHLLWYATFGSFCYSLADGLVCQSKRRFQVFCFTTGFTVATKLQNLKSICQACLAISVGRIPSALKTKNGLLKSDSRVAGACSK